MQEQEFKLISECLEKLEGQEITVGALNESLDSVPYPLEQKVVKTKSDISYIFADEAGDRYRIQFLTASKYGKGVVKVYIGKAKTEKMFVDKIDSFKNPRRMISTVIDFFHQHVMTSEGMQLRGFIVDLSGSASIRAIPLITKAIKLALVGKAKVVSTDFNPVEGRKLIWVVKGNLKPIDVFTVEGGVAPWEDPAKAKTEDKALLNNKAGAVKSTNAESSGFKEKLQTDVVAKYKSKDYIIDMKTSLPKHTIIVSWKGQTVTLLTVKDDEVINKYADILHTLSVQIDGFVMALKQASEEKDQDSAKVKALKTDAQNIVDKQFSEQLKQLNQPPITLIANGVLPRIELVAYLGEKRIADYPFMLGDGSQPNWFNNAVRNLTNKIVKYLSTIKVDEGVWGKGPIKDTLVYSVGGVIQATLSYLPTGKIELTKTGFKGTTTSPDTDRVLNLLRGGKIPRPDLDVLEKFVREIPTGSTEASIYELEQMGFRSVIPKDSGFSVKNFAGDILTIKEDSDGKFDVRSSRSTISVDFLDKRDISKLAQQNTYWFGPGVSDELIKYSFKKSVDTLVSDNKEMFSGVDTTTPSAPGVDFTVSAKFDIKLGNKFGISNSTVKFEFNFEFNDVRNRYKVVGFRVENGKYHNTTNKVYTVPSIALHRSEVEGLFATVVGQTVNTYIENQKKLAAT